MFEVDLPIGKVVGCVSKSIQLSEGVVPGIHKISFSCEPSIHAVWLMDCRKQIVDMPSSRHIAVFLKNHFPRPIADKWLRDWSANHKPLTHPVEDRSTKNLWHYLHLHPDPSRSPGFHQLAGSWIGPSPET
jgi:hypothetical protein